MIVSRTFGGGRLYLQAGVHITMTVEEFREHVEWLELIAPDDGCTKDFRAELDRIAPPAQSEDKE